MPIKLLQSPGTLIALSEEPDGITGSMLSNFVPWIPIQVFISKQVKAHGEFVTIGEKGLEKLSSTL